MDNSFNLECSSILSISDQEKFSSSVFRWIDGIGEYLGWANCPVISPSIYRGEFNVFYRKELNISNISKNNWDIQLSQKSIRVIKKLARIISQKDVHGGPFKRILFRTEDKSIIGRISRFNIKLPLMEKAVFTDNDFTALKGNSFFIPCHILRKIFCVASEKYGVIIERTGEKVVIYAASRSILYTTSFKTVPQNKNLSLSKKTVYFYIPFDMIKYIRPVLCDDEVILEAGKISDNIVNNFKFRSKKSSVTIVSSFLFVVNERMLKDIALFQNIINSSQELDKISLYPDLFFFNLNQLKPFIPSPQSGKFTIFDLIFNISKDEYKIIYKLNSAYEGDLIEAELWGPILDTKLYTVDSMNFETDSAEVFYRIKNILLTAKKLDIIKLKGSPANYLFKTDMLNSYCLLADI